MPVARGEIVDDYYRPQVATPAAELHVVPGGKDKPRRKPGADLRNAGHHPADQEYQSAYEGMVIRDSTTPVYRAVKRAFDIVFSLAVLVAFSWLYLIVAIAIKIDDPQGPVFYRQRRVGSCGREFWMYKFRSMVVNADELLADLQSQNEKTGPVFKMRNDPRITRVGRFLRKMSIDEMPQFINVLKGDLSVVGPRPAIPSEVAQYDDYTMQRLLVKPGLTCYWQTRNNRDAISFEEWVDLDLLYIQRRSFWSDFKLIVQTVGVVLTAQGS